MDSQFQYRKTRFAPSPTGYLHLGHLAHIVWLWTTADRYNAKIHLRLEDHDLSRCKEIFAHSIIEDLKWLGLLDTSVTLPMIANQTNLSKLNQYDSVANTLIQGGLVYACDCSRKDVALQQVTSVVSGSNQNADELKYNGRCRDRKIPLNSPNVSWRVKVPDRNFKISDLNIGDLVQNPFLMHGDFVIKDRSSNWTYNFCVVIDDLNDHIDLIVRGTDLLPSTGRQLALREMIAPDSNVPTFLHHPLLLDKSGKKLSKRHQSDSMLSAREQGLTSGQLIESLGLSKQLIAQFVKAVNPNHIDSLLSNP